jgi:hypothetical protein
MAAIGGEDDETPRSGGSARQGIADMPQGGGGSCRSSLESGEELAGDSDRQGGIRVRTDREGRE